MSQLTVSNLYNSRFAQRFLTWIRDTVLAQPDAMPAIAAPAAAAIAAIIFTTVAGQRHSSSNNRIAFSGIPTPKGARPLFGHILAIGTNRMGKFHEWHKELGPVFRFKMGVSTVLVVSDISMTHELLATMGKLTSNRPESATRYDFDSNGHNRGIILSQSNDKHWSVLRKSVLNALGPRKLKELSPVLCKEADEFVNLVATGENIDPLPQLMRVSLNFILLTLFSIRTTSLEDPLYKRGIYIVNKTMSFTHFKYIASQFIPVLRVIEPIIGNRKKAIQFLKYECKPFYLELVEKAMNAKDHNMTKAVNEEMNQGKEGYYNNLLPTIHDMILAGTDTTAVTISWGFLQISTRPEIQKKIQQEIDVFVTQNGRVPYFWERNEVPYLIATQRECLRLRPTTDLGVTHAAVEDFEWRGSLIPKGTSIMANMVEAHMDPEKYPDPEEFRPERFLDTHDTMASSANMRAENRDQYNFGWGRRICVGTHLAETQMFNVWVRALHKCDIVPAIGANGNQVPATLETVPPISGPIVVSPSSFEVRFVQRTTSH